MGEESYVVGGESRGSARSDSEGSLATLKRGYWMGVPARNLWEHSWLLSITIVKKLAASPSRNLHTINASLKSSESFLMNINVGLRMRYLRIGSRLR